MDFNTITFVGFFCGSAILTYCMPQKAKPYFLLLASYAFYLYQPQNAKLVGILIGATLISWVSGLLLSHSKITSESVRRSILLVGILCCLGFLFRFKYYLFASTLYVNTINAFGGHLVVKSLNLVVPLGLSYFLFQSMGYMIDVYRRKQKPVFNFAYYALFVSFFPCIFTGPIERAGHLIPQFSNPHRFNYNRMSGGAFRMLWGYFKKMVLADGIGVFVSSVYAAPEKAAGPYLLVASLLFSYQLYLDFSGCCDIAIGGARILGFDLIENFDRPFAACNYSDLWRRWHISLSSWFRDYLYIPLGGNKHGKFRQSLNLFLTFLASGLWHGASWGYVIWGALNGLILIIGKQTASIRLKFQQHNPLYRLKPLKKGIQQICVYLLFTACIVFFASDLYGGNALAVYGGLFKNWSLSANGFLTGILNSGLSLGLIAVLIIGSLVVELVEMQGCVAQWIRKRHFIIRWALYYTIALAILFFAAFGKSAFIYQNY